MFSAHCAVIWKLRFPKMKNQRKSPFFMVVCSIIENKGLIFFDKERSHQILRKSEISYFFSLGIAVIEINDSIQTQTRTSFAEFLFRS